MITGIEKLDLPSGRVYRTPVGDLPGVSGILDATMPEEDRASLEAWRKRVGEETANAIRDAACARGTAIHALAEQQIREGITPEVPRELQNYWAALVEDLPDRETTLLVNHTVYGGDRLAIELPVYHAELRYGGTLDWAGYWRGDDTLWLLDFKTSEKAKTEKHVLRHSIQLAAYAMALESMTGVTVDRAGVLIARPSGSGQKFLFDAQQMRLARCMWKTRVEQYYQDQAAIAVA
jgi:CRISPR/Cas system-associated exonuclease Cas4 (RecB family)